jgi:glycosyltransferase involved in cell wall biosynthesis
MMRKPIVLTFVGYYLPGCKSGGPIRTIANMVERIGDELDFRIVTSDRDYLDPQPYPNVARDRWNEVGKARVFYASPGRRSFRGLARLIRTTCHDVLYLNSFFSQLTMRPLLARRLGIVPKRPIVIAPRGEFTGESFLIKRWKKLPYVRVARACGLYRDLTWQASSEFEAADIQRALGSTARCVVVAPNLPAVCREEATQDWEGTRHDGRFRVCSIARLSPEKNLAFALRALADAKVPLEFNIYGVASDEPYWKHCQELMNKLPAHVTARYHGVLDHALVSRTLAAHDLLFFPTLGENYGHIVFEALAVGTPVLISDKTPWKNLQGLGVGWDLPLDNVDPFLAVLDTLAAFDRDARLAQRRRVMQYAQQVSSDETVVVRNLGLFMDLVEET